MNNSIIFKTCGDFKPTQITLSKHIAYPLISSICVQFKSSMYKPDPDPEHPYFFDQQRKSIYVWYVYTFRVSY